jgi:hypothetical protein
MQIWRARGESNTRPTDSKLAQASRQESTASTKDQPREGLTACSTLSDVIAFTPACSREGHKMGHSRPAAEDDGANSPARPSGLRAEAPYAGRVVDFPS